MKAIFKAVQDRITANVPAVRWVDFDLGQLDQEKPPVSYPCALIGFNSGEYTALGMSSSLGTITLEIAVAFQLRERTHSVADQQYRDEALTHLDTVDAVRVALEGLLGANFTAMNYLGFSNDRRADLRVWRLRFICEHYPQAPEPPFEPLPDGVHLDLCLNVEIKAPE